MRIRGYQVCVAYRITDRIEIPLRKEQYAERRPRVNRRTSRTDVRTLRLRSQWRERTAEYAEAHGAQTFLSYSLPNREIPLSPFE